MRFLPTKILVEHHNFKKKLFISICKNLTVHARQMRMKLHNQRWKEKRLGAMALPKFFEDHIYICFTYDHHKGKVPHSPQLTTQIAAYLVSRRKWPTLPTLKWIISSLITYYFKAHLHWSKSIYPYIPILPISRKPMKLGMMPLFLIRTLESKRALSFDCYK